MGQGTINSASLERVEFDLLRNPFVILRLPLTAPKENIAEAFDEALADGHFGDEVLRDARRQLLAPKLRLAAAVELLVDANVEQRHAAISKLQDTTPLSDLIAFSKELPMASRASFLSDVARLRPSSGMLRGFALISAAVDRNQLRQSIGRIFEEASLPRPTDENIAEAFEASTARNIKRLFLAYRDAKIAAADMQRCLDDGMGSASSDQLAAYSLLVAGYLEYASAPMSELRHRIDVGINRFRADTADQAALEEIETSLLRWDELSQPAQLLAQQKGRDEPQARELFQHLRGFMIELANEKNAPAAALRISKICTNVFAELPRAVAQLKDDLGALQGLVDQEGAKDLIEFVEKIRSNLDPVVADLNGGFGPTAIGDAKRLYVLFDQSVKATKGTGAMEIPWGLVRILALDINNDLGEGAASEALIAGMISHSGFAQAPEQIKALIQTDRQILRTNAAQARLTRAINKNDTAAVRQALVDLAALATDESERKQMLQGIANLDAAKRKRIVGRIFWAIVIVGVIIAVASQDGGRSKSSYSTPTYRPAATPTVTQPSATTAEIKPLPYSSAAFSRENLRYCQFESARIAAINTMMINESDRVISLFNQVVDDYNSRCSNYRYYENDLTVVQRELTAGRAQISADARTILQRWRMSN
ncbi:hypothetical protein [Mesorhizobium sp. M1374]|uniref:hypothetical protein n=1 Tax=Mesorhizobium sp. M1374 TaxID=2957091 RepID=UPI00333AC9A7